ncbi:MAG: NUDIX domain-containing protein [Kiritimatiellae bacterium]|nr:NUDIX domain-containing protein [Kiritimatiellia bacterium]
METGAAVPREYELAGIETIARGVAVVDGKLLLCRAKGSATSYLPGGHIEFGETGREALVREIREELGVAAKAGRFLGVVENSFMQHGRPHAEINLVYELAFDGPLAEPRSVEDWISFEWCELARLGEAGLLPEVFRRLADGPSVRFEP